MKLTKATTELICKLEAIIGNQCYNPNSYDGYTMEQGRVFRYPVHYVDKDQNNRKTSYRIEDIDKKDIGTIHYKFGSNQLYVGDAIVEVLEYLEKTYDLNFNELTKVKK